MNRPPASPSRSESPLERYGWDPALLAAGPLLERGRRPGRVVAEHRGEYSVVTEEGERRAEVSGRLRLAIRQGERERPAVGDWVALDLPSDADQAIIHAVLPRRSKLSRKAAGREDIEQVIAANVDAVFLVSSLDHDLNARRIERYLAVIWESGAKPVVVLTKSDLCPQRVNDAVDMVRHQAPGVPVFALSALTGEGVEQLDAYLAAGLTVALVGSSGVGKSTLLNRWLGQQRQAVQEVRSDGKGRHTTTHREMLPLPSGGLVVDTPGMRELAVWADDDEQAEAGLQDAFADVTRLSESCRFRDCRHEGEPGCAVALAIEQGELEAPRLASYLKLRAEAEAADRRYSRRGIAESKKAARTQSRAIKAFYRDVKQKRR